MAEEMDSHEGESERQPRGVITNKKFVFYLYNVCNSCILLQNAFLFVLIQKCLKLFTIEQDWSDASDMQYLYPADRVQVAHGSDPEGFSHPHTPQRSHGAVEPTLSLTLKSFF